jgi:hypothetical protein
MRALKLIAPAAARQLARRREAGPPGWRSDPWTLVAMRAQDQQLAGCLRGRGPVHGTAALTVVRTMLTRRRLADAG